MTWSPDIEARAWELLNAPDGFNGYTADEIKNWGRRRCDYISRNSVRVAICMARDEVWCRCKVGLTNAAFRSLESRIVRMMRDRAKENDK